MHNNLTVLMLLGRDWEEFDQLLTSRGPPSGGARGRNRRRPAIQHSHRPPLMATESELEGECNSPNLFSDPSDESKGKINECGIADSKYGKWTRKSASQRLTLSRSSSSELGCSTVSPNGGGRKKSCSSCRK